MQSINMTQLMYPKTEPFLSNFIRKLVQLLNNKQYSQIVSWMPNGIGFLIKDFGKFSSKVLPSYYRHANMPSFVRQLNMYGFHKIKQTDFSYYHHQYFIKDKPQLFFKITRKPQKKSSCQNFPANEKQNSQPSIKQTETKQAKRGNKKKVSFGMDIEMCNDEKSENSKKKVFATNQIMSNISIKYLQCSKNNQSLFGLNSSCMDLLKGFQADNVSIGVISDHNIPRAEQFLKSSRKMVSWNLSQNDKNEDLVDN